MKQRWLLLVISICLVLVLLLPACAEEESAPTSAPATTAAPVTTSAPPKTTAAPATTSAPPKTTAAPAPAGPKYGGILRIGYANEATTLGQPAVGAVSEDGQLAAPAIEQLRKIKENGDYYPWLAKSWEADPEALTVTIVMNKGIKFHDGTACDAKAIKWNYDWLLTNKTNAVQKVASVEIVDDLTIQINLKEWGSDILYDVTGVYVVSPAAWEKNGDDWGKQNPVGTGPFKFVSRQRDMNIIYEKFDDYWQEGKPYLDGVEFIIIKDPTTRIASFKAGEVDLSMDLSIAQAQELSKDSKYLVHRGIGGGGSYRLNPDGGNADSPFSNVKVRQAIGYAIDRKALVEGVLGGYATVATQQFPEDSWVFNPNIKEPYTYNPEKAKQLLSEAGYGDGFETRLIGMNTGHDPLILAAIQNMLAKVNIKANLDLGAAPAVMQTWRGGWNNALGFSRLPPNPQMVTWCTNFTYKSTRQTSVSLLSDPEIDELAIKATTWKGDFASRQKLVWDLMEMIYYTKAQSIPLYLLDSLLVKYPYVKDDGLYGTVQAGEWHPETAWLDK